MRHRVLRLGLADGVMAAVGVIDRMRGPVFKTVRTEEGFRRVAVDHKTGTVAWPGGADLASDVSYERASAGSWPSRDMEV